MSQHSCASHAERCTSRPRVNARASWWGCEGNPNPTRPIRTRCTWRRDRVHVCRSNCADNPTRRIGIHTSSRCLRHPGACVSWLGYAGSPIRGRPSRNRGTCSLEISSGRPFDKTMNRSSSITSGPRGRAGRRWRWGRGTRAGWRDGSRRAWRGRCRRRSGDCGRCRGTNCSAPAP